MTTKQILVLGGGYGGVMTALRLAGKIKKLDAVVTLVNGLDHFVERPRLHEQATGTSLNQRPLEDMLRGSPAQFLQGWVTAIDPERQCVIIQTTTGEVKRPYDYLVNALGSQVNRQVVPGVNEHAFTLDPYGASTTDDLARKLQSFGPHPFRAAVVGGGATGVEAATQIKQMYPQSEMILITQGQAGAFKGEHIRQHIADALQAQQIRVYESWPVAEVTAEGILSNDEKIPADLVIWAGGFTAAPLAEAAGLAVNSRRQMLVDPYLRSLTHPNIFAVGDAAQPVEEPGAPWRMSLYTALVSGAQAADNIAADLKGQSMQPLSYATYGQGIALGVQDAVGFPTYPADVAWSFVLRRRTAVTIRNFFVWALGAVLELERRWPGAFFWNGKGRYARQQRRRTRSTESAPQV